MIYRLYYYVVIKIYKKVDTASGVFPRGGFTALNPLFLNYQQNSLLIITYCFNFCFRYYLFL